MFFICAWNMRKQNHDVKQALTHALQYQEGEITTPKGCLLTLDCTIPSTTTRPPLLALVPYLKSLDPGSLVPYASVLVCNIQGFEPL